MNRYPNAEAFEQLPDAERPSATNYLRHHSWEETSERMKHGVTKKLREFLVPNEWRKSGRELLPFRGWLVAIFIAMFAAMGILRVWAMRQKARWVWPVGHQSARWMVLFAVGVFAVSVAAFGFYEPIGKGDRFLLSLFLPLVVTPLWIAERFRRQLQRTDLARVSTWIFFGMHMLVVIAVVVRLLHLLADPVFQRS
jgi:hypothetical protein